MPDAEQALKVMEASGGTALEENVTGALLCRPSGQKATVAFKIPSTRYSLISEKSVCP
jgi:hypothetical protein